MESPNIVEIEWKYDALAHCLGFTITWIESQRKVAVIGSDVDEPMSMLTLTPPKIHRVTSPQMQT